MTARQPLRTTPMRDGFSLIEALVVLAISGMALAVIFTIGTKAGDTGFSLGRRAMAASDSDIAIGDLRSVIRSVALRPPATFSGTGQDRPVIGESLRIDADVVMERANVCAPLGWAGRMVLEIETDQGSSRLTCEAGGRKNVLIDLGPGESVFSYSRDGRAWSPAYSNAPGDTPDRTDPRSETVWVRLVSPSGEIIESATSSQVVPWFRIEDVL